MDHSAALKEYNQRIEGCLGQISHIILTNFIDQLIKFSKIGGSIFIAGNGGSAATANHFATDLSKLGHKNKLVAESLNSNVSLITMLANDFGYSKIFSKQLELKANSKSLVLVISASGNSKNLVKCVQFASRNKVKTAALIGFDGGSLKNLVDFPILVKSEIGEYGLVEDCHSIICHYISSILKNAISR
jgi:D-sedoheptulose 7-phosphate isomerase